MFYTNQNCFYFEILTEISRKKFHKYKNNSTFLKFVLFRFLRGYLRGIKYLKAVIIIFKRKRKVKPW